uniref:Lipid binding protein n=1 Tax=Rhizophora mucronata TaxID=61149 RepID=A0A2P2KPL4_RHIMU
MSITRLTTIIAATAIILASAVVSAKAPAPAPFSPTAPAPFSVGPSAPVPAASNDCMTALFNMSDCLTYVENVSTLTVPDKKCCPELAGLIESKPICLCQMLANSSMTESFGITIDVTRALKLPSACRLKTPPLTLCSLAGYPVPGPTASAASPPGIASLFNGPSVHLSTQINLVDKVYELKNQIISPQGAF